MRSTTERRLLAAAVTAWLVALAPAARADDKAAAKQAAEQATTDYKLGNFEAALAGYSEAYRLYPAPKLLFNIAQCHRNLGHYEQAIHFYEGYLRELPDARNRADVEALLEETRAALERQRAAEAEERRRQEARAEAERQRAEAERQRAEAERLAAERRLQQQLAQQQAERERERAAAPIYRKWWFWTAVGAAAILAGGTVYAVSHDSGELPSGSLGRVDAR